jgi:hypothetical protein
LFVTFDPDTPETTRALIRLEDVLIGVCLVAFMILALGSSEKTEHGETLRVMWRDTSAGQAAMIAIGVAMFVVFVIRLRRVHRAFHETNDED